METITISVNKVAIGVALLIGLVVGGAIGCFVGTHHDKYMNRGQFHGNYGPVRSMRPMMDQNTMNKMMPPNTKTTTVEAAIETKPVQ